MSWVGKAVKEVTDATAGGIIDAVGNVADKLFTSDAERAEANLLLERLRQQPHLLQAEINKIEASHRTIFVAGWRPFIGWVCGVSLGWHFIGYDFAVWLSTFAGYSAGELPKLENTNELFPLVMALLGLGGLRTFEKNKGVAK